MKRKLALASGYIIIILLAIVAIFFAGRNYSVYIPVDDPNRTDNIKIEYSDEGIVENCKIDSVNYYSRLVFTGLKPGQCDVTVTINVNEHSTQYRSLTFNVLKTGVLYLSGYDYGGWQITLLAMALIMIYSCVICFVQFKKRKKTQFFSYKTVLDLALSVFFVLQGLVYLALFALCMMSPYRVDSWQAYSLAGLSMMGIFILSIPFLVLFAGFLIISNLSLIRHEGFRRNNLFGIFISIFMFVGAAACIFFAIQNPNSLNIEMFEIRDVVLRTLISSAFVYFECLLLSAMYCTRYASRHKVKFNQDFIIILGCKIASDGKPLGLLKGRIDRAIAFYKQQLEQTGKQACFIPSGGQGNDEIISEAESMKNYLIEQGIDPSIILPETKSATTLENMKFSKKIADEHKKDANIVFSTTNYHVFRSGMFSAKVGMKADGIGAKTKWYFWPNAQAREFIGLLASQWKINLAFVALITILSLLFANISTIIEWLV